ncbi:UDP-galactopyranose mutase [Erythrobacter arachoides]|uniref:UDP-galactopyranose mutase n=1 Tax=Aurantiacibacter arachoides TaxID=1850444 RepID=A0A844ZX83_9SPHN|nr:UDP-galactopyranose mutase [Aurantiacibacter arachoides]MXO92348.1 UDP-galactopyranose mutase [Aurantiacibacter arachoides]GGD57908.1 UDP-galactopyranose mutase [Aurantiacibacter arachoides]
MTDQTLHSHTPASDPAPQPFAPASQAPSDALDDLPLVVFSHLRWDFVRQRPQHLLSRFARQREVWMWEEPIGCDHPLPYLEYHRFPADRVTSLRPRLPHWWSAEEQTAALADLYALFLQQSVRAAPIAWYYTPLMRAFSAGAEAALVVYDCMDELSSFAHADAALLTHEAELLERADVVFTGGRSLYEAKRHLAANVHAFPSAVDRAHFAAARATPRSAGGEDGKLTAGYFGVIDERLDMQLIAELAAARPDWRIEMVGPVVKIDPATLPQAANIAWLGPRDYGQLPAVLAGWDVAIMPFALNEATRFISPTKTPEYLSGGRPVVSTPIADVVADWGRSPGVWIAGDGATLAQALDDAASLSAGGDWLAAVDRQLDAISWDATQQRMADLMGEALSRRTQRARSAAVSVPAVSASDRLSAKPYDVLVVGAGFAGSVMAERLAEDAGKRVLVIDRRPHIAGNAYDELDAAGVMIHRYGPHIFHTNSDDVFAYLSRFTAWRPYEHRVLAEAKGKRVPMPINRTTLEQLYDIALPDDESAAAFLAARALPRDPIVTSEDVVVNAVGTDLYQTFFRGYTRKQWGLDPSELDKTVTSRVPTRTDRDDRYFQDRHQAMPRDGYTAMFARMLDHPRITLRTGTEFVDVDAAALADHVVYTGPIDEYFDYRYGRLPYRSLTFRHETLPQESFQDAAVVNFPAEDVPYTRITEYKKLTGQSHPTTSISYEYPTDEGDPYYPIPRPDNQALFQKYDALARATQNVTFVGRLANYRYYNMDQVVGQALATYRRLSERELVEVAKPLGTVEAAE